MVFRANFDKWVGKILGASGLFATTAEMVAWWPAGSTAEWVAFAKEQQLSPPDAACIAIGETVLTKVKGGELPFKSAAHILFQAEEIATKQGTTAGRAGLAAVLDEFDMLTQRRVHGTADMADRPDLYVVLGISPSATPEQIRRAYRERVRVLHPDRFDHVQDPAAWNAANQMLLELNAAYNLLTNPGLRNRYDRVYAEQSEAKARRQPAAKEPPPPHAPRERPTAPVEKRARRKNRLWLLLLLVLPFLWVVYSASDGDQRDDDYSLSGPQRDLIASRAALLEPGAFGCDLGVESSPLPKNGQVWRYTNRPPRAPLEVTTEGGVEYLVKLEENGDPIAMMLIRGDSTAEMLVPLGRYTVKYATGTGAFWCGQDARLPFGSQTDFQKADEDFDFTIEGDRYSGYVLELILQQGGNLQTVVISADTW